MNYKEVLDRTKKPTNGNQIKLNIPEPDVVILDNGIKTYIINEGNIEYSKIDVVFKAGTAYQSKSLIAESAIQLLIDGTTSKTSEEIANVLDYSGALIDTNLTKDTASLTLYSLNKQLPNLLPLLYDIISNPEFSEDELENYTNRKRHQFLLNNDKVKYKAMLEFNQLVFGSETAYGKVKNLEDYNNIERDDLNQFHNMCFNTKDIYVVVSGKINKESITLINKYLGKLHLSDSQTNHQPIEFVQDVTPAERFIGKTNSLQSAIRVGQPIIGKNHPDHNSLIVYNTILGGYFGSRLMSNLRENKGYTYGINSYIMNYKYGSYWCISTEVNAKHTKSALKELQIEINKLRTKKVSNSELELVKNYLYGIYLRSFDGPMAKADRLRSAHDLNFNFHDYVNNLNEMMNQTPDQILVIANQYFDFDNMIKLVVGVLENDSFN